MTRASTLRLVDGTRERVLVPAVSSYADPIWMISNNIEFPAPRVVDRGRVGRSGKLDDTYLHDAAMFTAEIRISGDNESSRHVTWDDVKSYLAPHKRSYLYFWREGWLTERRCLLRGDQASCVIDKSSHTTLVASISAVIPDGVSEEADLSVVTLRPGGLSIGMNFPMSFPFSFEPANNTNSSLIEIDSSTKTPPLITIWGGCTNPVFSIQVDDQPVQQLAFINTVIPVGNYLTIDVANREIYLNGNRDVSYLSGIDFTVSDWFELEIGTNDILFSATTADTSCYAELSYRMRWI